MRSRAANPPPRSGCFVVLMICEFHLNVIRVRLKGIDSMCHLIRRRIVDVLHFCNRELYFQSDMHKLLQPPIRSTVRTINLVCTFSCSFSFLIHWARCTLQTVLLDCVFCVSQGSRLLISKTVVHYTPFGVAQPVHFLFLKKNNYMLFSYICCFLLIILVFFVFICDWRPLCTIHFRCCTARPFLLFSLK